MPCYHLVFTLPAAIGAIACQNKATVYDRLFKASAETLTTIAADPKHLGLLDSRLRALGVSTYEAPSARYWLGLDRQ